MCQTDSEIERWLYPLVFQFYTTMKRLFIASLMSAAGAVALGAPELPGCGVVLEVWDNVKGEKIKEVAEVSGERPADSVYVKERIDDFSFGKDDFAARYSAWLTVPQTGEYTFYLAADDSAELLLSTSESVADLKKLCEVPYYMPRHHFVPGRSSAKVKLEKGKKYALAVHFKDAVKDDHVALAWEGPGIRKSIIDTPWLTPRMGDGLKKIWEKTIIREVHGKELITELLGQNRNSVAGWLEKLSKEDMPVLLEALQSIQSQLLSKGNEAVRSGMRDFAMIASGISASAECPVYHPVARQLLFMEEDWLKSLTLEELTKLGAHRLADTLGKIAPGAQLCKTTQKINSAGDKWREEYVSLGLYAAPGKPFSITIPKELAGCKLELQVGHHFPEKHRPLICMPGTSRWFKLDKETSTFVSPHGGLMLLMVPKTVELKDTPVCVDGALRAPQFILGKHSDADWKALRRAPAPWGELVSEHLVLLVPREVLQKLDNPTALMTWWNENNRDLEDFYAYYPKVPFRMHSGHYAEEGLSYWPLQWDVANVPNLLDLSAMKTTNSALFLHEHGHHCDFWEMELSFWAESTTNWGGYYLKDREGLSFDWKDSHDLHLRNLFDSNNKSMKEIMEEKWYKVSTKGTHHWSYAVTSMMIAYAEDFGWDCVKTAIKRLRDQNDGLYKWNFIAGDDHDQAKIDRYLIALSVAAGRDVRPYFAHFKMFPSGGTVMYLNSLNLPKWDMTYLAEPKVTVAEKNTTLTIPCGAPELLSFAKDSRIHWVKQTAEGGTVVYHEKGEAFYTPAPGFSGVDTLTYELSNEYGVTVKKTLKITVK